MNFDFTVPKSIDLFVKGRITKTDADRQRRTVVAILERLKKQPGLILADEVGMGKTFVALGVAITVYLKEKRPTVIMIPHNLVDKWPNDFKLFREACITDENSRSQLRYGVAKRPEEFLKLLDDSESRRSAVIFLTHGALTRNLGDGLIKLAIIKRALYNRWGNSDLIYLLGKYAGALIEMQYLENRNKEINIWEILLRKSPREWKSILHDKKIVDADYDDPVPEKFIEELEKIDSREFDQFYADLHEQLPKRASDNLKERLTRLRRSLAEETRKIWAICLSRIRHDLPLLIFDEAHHLKNSQTQIVTKLFQDPETESEAGLLAGQFDRMLFLTATPFQLGHHELLNVLNRFSTINWKSKYSEAINSADYRKEMETLLKKLDHSQIAARKLDLSWGKLKMHDLIIEGKEFQDVYQWWEAANAVERSTLSQPVQKVIEDFNIAKSKLQEVEPLLKKYVIRHLKPRVMGIPFEGISRRKNLPGNSIAVEENQSNLTSGLQINKESLLPFLLASRLSAIQMDKRPVFAEGLASSYEAFVLTSEERRKRLAGRMTDLDDDYKQDISNEVDEISKWYLDQLAESLSKTVHSSDHPKLRPTVQKAIELWSKGEKVLIFCHYIATGKALRKHISNEMRSHIKIQGAQKFSCSEEAVFDELEKIANRISSPESPLHRVTLSVLNDLVNEFPGLESLREEIVAAMVRYMKTPSFLVRFGAETSEFNEAWLMDSFNTKDGSGISLLEVLKSFLKFLDNRKEDQEGYVKALKSIQPGGIRSGDVKDAFTDDEHPDENETTIMANVRLCYGATLPETRQKLMKTFNTPFFPDILITSSVMAEGVDLHLNCRHIIHHDLSWNPSTLEQRTGRVDRIGAKAEMCGRPIYVYMPYLSETQDEKMYRVVTERERWFNIVMGEKYKVDAFSTDKYAERIQLPEELASELAFKLEVE